MKSLYQSLSLLSHHIPATDIDRQEITSYLQKNFKAPVNFPIFADYNPDNITATPSITFQQFTKWLEEGFGISSVAYIPAESIKPFLSDSEALLFLDDSFITPDPLRPSDKALAILGSCSLYFVNVLGFLLPTVKPSIDNPGKFVAIPENVTLTLPVSALTSVDTPFELLSIYRAMFNEGLQINFNTLRLAPKYIPGCCEKVIFYSADKSMKGLGIIRNVNKISGNVEFYCYYIYPSVSDSSVSACPQKPVGFSMHEKDVASLITCNFEPMMDDKQHIDGDNGISAYRRLKKELNKVGKIWNDRLNRIEPLEVKRKVGEKYWYINDKLKVVTEIEKGTSTSHFRYFAGNYFTDLTAALIISDKIGEIFRDYLASESYPDICPIQIPEED